ncbi:hypothetical protein ACIA8O_05105 [Kitasatospora sp. NPDC051853]|uniref:hypothetical protein n=1 Tax=Kitasatospora sp. NPDC051853 TaxID=3364058 RepID=UPI0037A854A6
MRRVIGVLAALVLLGGVAYAVLRPESGPGLTEVRILIGSEKAEFFNDPEVAAEFRAKGFEVKSQTIGSWSMANANLDGYGMVFPASRGPAEEVAKKRGITTEPVRPFYSPLVVIAHEKVAALLRDRGYAGRKEGGPWKLDMAKYLTAVGSDTRWDQLDEPKSIPELAGDVFVTSTDPATSSSGALYLAAAAYVKNGNRVVSDQAGEQSVAPLLRKLTAKQGDQKTSSDGPFKDFQSGVGNPLVLAYESQVASLVAHGTTVKDLVVLYPDTTVSSDHTALGLTPEGRKIAELLRDDPKLIGLAALHGFRPQADPGAFSRALKEPNPTTVFVPGLAEAGIVQAQPPTVEVLARLVDIAKGK